MDLNGSNLSSMSDSINGNHRREESDRLASLAEASEGPRQKAEVSNGIQPVVQEMAPSQVENGAAPKQSPLAEELMTLKVKIPRTVSSAPASGSPPSAEDMMTMRVKLPDPAGGEGTTMRIKVPRASASDPSAVGAAVAHSLQSGAATAPPQPAPFPAPGHVAGAPAPQHVGQPLPMPDQGGGGRVPRRPSAMEEYPDEDEFIPDEAPRIGRELSLRDIFFMVRERWILGLSVGLLLAGGLAYWMMSKPPTYQSSAELLVEMNQNNVLGKNIEALEEEGSTTLEQVMQVHAKSVQSLAYRQYVEKSLMENRPVAKAFGEDPKGVLEEFRSYDAFKRAYVDGLIHVALRGKKPDEVAVSELPDGEELFRNHFYKAEGPLDVTTPKRSQFLAVSFRHPDPRVAKQVAQAYVSCYNPFLDEKEKRRYAGAGRFLKDQVDALKKEKVRLEREILTYKRANGITESEDGSSLMEDNKTSALASQATNAQVDLMELEIQLKGIENIASGDVINLSQVPVINQFGTVAEARAVYDALDAERAELDQRYLERHPKMISNATKMVDAKQRLDDVVALAVQDLRNRVEQKRNEKANLESALDQAKADSLADDDPLVQYRLMVSELKAVQEKHDSLLDRYQDTEISERLQRSKVDVMTPAVLPEHPIDPDKKKVLALASLLLLGGLFGLPIGLGFLDTRLKSFSEAEAFLGMECLGCIPERPKLTHMELGQCVLAERDDQIIEGFRVVYGSVDLHSKVAPPKAIVTSSTGGGEGKSFVTANLAATFARHGKRVIIIDGDLRKPSQHKLIDVKNDAGLLKWFRAGGVPPQSAKELVESDTLGLVPLSEEHDIFLLRAGGSTRNPSEIITSKPFEALVNNLRDWFDIIMIDTPPVGLFPDALFLANYAEEALFVCKHNGLNRHKIKFALKKMEGGNAEVLGTVMNQLSASKRHQYGYGYKDYGYGSYSYREYADYYHAEDEDEK